MKPNIIKSRYCGFCSGVTRAIRMAVDATGSRKVYTLGPIIHNPQVVENLEKKNIIAVNSADEIGTSETALIRSHGITSEEESRIRECGHEVIDATCPKVKRAQKICEDLSSDWSRVFIVGQKTHPEVKGILSRAGKKGRVISSVEEAAGIERFEDGGVLAQTTFRPEEFFKIVGILAEKGRTLKIHNTICEETVSRQQELVDLAKNVDLIVVVGGRNSSNTKRLYELASELTSAVHVEIPEDISYKMIQGRRTIGIVTGASSPADLVTEIEDKINKLYKERG